MKSLAISVALLCSLLTPGVSAGMFNSKSSVKVLTAKNFKSTVTKSDKLTVAAFVAPWCGHCKNLVPEYEKAADNLMGLVNVVAVDCDADENKRMCSEYEVKGFPTVKIFPSGKASPLDYQGPRTAKGIVDYALGMMPTFAKRIKNPDDLKKIMAQSPPPVRPISLLFTSRGTPSPLYKALSTDFRKTIDFYFVVDKKGEYEEVRKSLQVPKGDAGLVVVWDEGEGKGGMEPYSGKFKHELLYDFYDGFRTGEHQKKRKEKARAIPTVTTPPTADFTPTGEPRSRKQEL